MMRLSIITFLIVICSLVFIYAPSPDVSKFGGAIFEIARENSGPVDNEVLPWRWEDKLKEAEDILKKINLSVSALERTYTEEIYSISDLLPKRKIQRDRDREIALALLEKATGDIRVVLIAKKGTDIISPHNYPIEIVPRSNGIRWNKWNTQFKPPEGYIVIMNSYPDVTGKVTRKIVTDSRGYKRTVYEPEIEYFIYAPYSDELHVPELVEAGREHIKKIVIESREKLNNLKVRSKAFPGQLLTDVAVLKPEFFHLLPLIEQTDLSEFILDPQKTSERVLALIGANKDRAFVKTGSFAGALGWVQYTRPTYDTIRHAYPDAKLIADFQEGAADHANSMLAAILLYDYHLARFMNRSGDSIAQNQNLEEYLAAAYNGGPGRILASLSAVIGKDMEWTDKVHVETQGYIIKLRTMHELGIMN